MNPLDRAHSSESSFDLPDDTPDAVDIATVLPETVQGSSRELGWWPLNVERREAEPAQQALPGGTTEHLIFVSLAEGHYLRQSADESSEHPLEAGHVSIHPARRPVRWEWDTHISTTVLALDPEFLCRVATDTYGMKSGGYELLLVDRVRDPIISHIAAQLMREVVRGDQGSASVASALAHHLAVHLVRHYTRGVVAAQLVTNDSMPRAVSVALDFINRAYGRDISLQDMAIAAHVSPFHLSRQFKKAVGMTPHQYLIQTRVESARALLAAGSRSLAEVASAVGFSDQSHLTRQFKRVLGVTPGQVRQ